MGIHQMTARKNVVAAALGGTFLLLTAMSTQAGHGASATVSYNRDIRPLLSDKCFACHGPDAGKRKGQLRLDLREEALKREAFVPGKPDKSELVERIYTTNLEQVMPPTESSKTLTAAEKDMLRRWIAAGAEYEGHWAYEKPVKPATPADTNPVDWLVDKRLREVGLAPSAEADHRTLARRLYFDLIGLPPKPEEAEAFIHDKSPNAYDRLVEKLMASPHYGERMAIGWLDVVRFADTIGYHSDNPRNIWPYRDYVIKAFNDNKRFDVFTREQLAGDLLPESGQEQKVGSALNRLLLTTEEGGAQPKDYEARMLTDRVRAVGTVWLGQTIGCAQCHDHKFDPFTMRDFYSLGAFFADIKEVSVGRREDGMLVPDNAQAAELAEREAEVKRLEAEYGAPHSDLHAVFAEWQAGLARAVALDRSWMPLQPGSAKAAGGDKLQIKPDHSILVSGEQKPDRDSYTLVLTDVPAQALGLRIEVLPDESLPARGPGRAANGNFVLSRVIASLQRTNGSSVPVRFAAARASFEQTIAAEKHPDKKWSAASVIDPKAQDEVAGWAILPEVGKPHYLILDCGSPLALEDGDTLKVELQQNQGYGSHTLGRFRISATADLEAVRTPPSPPPPKEIVDILNVPVDQREQAQKDKLWEEFKRTTPALAQLRGELDGARKARADFEATIPRCLVSVSDEKPRSVRILPRGNFLIETGDLVRPAFPAVLKASWQPFEKPQLTRRDLAEWLVSPDNPLTARVVMNRLWKQFFGVGLAKPLDDFGAQGEAPRNPELLDWLACEFMDSGWDLKHMVRLLVHSQTYRQTSRLSKKAQALDPYNREFSAQGRWRLEAELVRDNALAISGLLVDKIGGPSVKPYQPEGYWENLNFPTRTWDQSPGDGLYRRGLYTWWQRSYLHPSLVAFDAPSREECCAERTRSNIPQQALALLNDPTYVEASRAFAARILKEGGLNTEARVRWAWQQALDRPPRKDEMSTARTLLTKHLGEYRDDLKSAEAVLRVGAAPLPDHYEPAELAAWTSVARVILNLHETITRN
jgi:hypothetical protein